MRPIRKTTAAIIALAGLAAAAPAFAQGMARPDPFGDATIARKDAEADAVRRFAALDANHDGSLSTEELAAARPQRPAGAADAQRRGGGDRMRGMMRRMMDPNGDGKVTQDEYVAVQLRRFDRMDGNHDGQLTAAERKAAMEAMRQRMAERMAGGMSGGMGGMGGGGDGPSAGD